MFRRLLSVLMLLTSISAIAYTQQKSTKVVVNEMVFYLPGNWQHYFDNPEHGQHAFTDTVNGLELVIVAHDLEIMKFYNDTLSNFELARAAFKWNVDHWLDEEGMDVKKLGANTASNYIIWGLDNPEEKVAILYGVRDGKMIGLHLMKKTEGNIDADRALILLFKIFNDK